MRSFSPRMFPHRSVRWPLIEAAGLKGGTKETFPEPASGPLPCRVRYSNERAVTAASGEASFTPVQVAFPSDPGVRLGERLRVVGGRDLRVLGPAQDRGGFGLFVVTCEVVD